MNEIEELLSPLIQGLTKQIDFEEKVEAKLREEATKPDEIWYISFAEPKGWLGAIVTKAPGFVTAIQRTHDAGINPGGEALGHVLHPDNLPKLSEGDYDKLLNLEEAKKIFGEMENSRGEVV